MDARTWNDYDNAIKNLEEELARQKKDKSKVEPYELSRNAATRVCDMSPSVFGREVPCSSIFRAYYHSPRYTGKSSYYRIPDLIEHFKRIKQREENVRLLYEFYTHGEKWFKSAYGEEPSFVFEEGTYLPIGDFNPEFTQTKKEIKESE